MLSQSLSARSLALSVAVISFFACNSNRSDSSPTGSSTAGVLAAGFSPPGGTIGTMVVVSGSGFSTDPFQNTVRFGGKTGVAATVEVATTTTLVTRVPVGAKTGKIFVASPAGESITIDDFVLSPLVSGFNPNAATVGSIVEIRGSGFAEIPTDNAVTLGSLALPILDGDTSRLLVSMPPGAVTGTVIVSTPGGSVSKGPLIVLPSITGASAAFGLPGDVITIAGFNFRSVLTDNQVAFNGAAASVSAADYSSLTVTVPAGFSTGSITVTTPDGTAVGPVFIFPQTPVIANFTPGTGVTGTSVHIDGSEFLPGVMGVKFHGVASLVVTNQTTTSLDAIVPPGATTGSIEVSHPYGSSSSSNPFTILVSPTVTGIDPVLGSPGTVVRVTGTNFDTTPSGNTVSFGPGAVATIANVSATGLDAVVPANAVTGPVTLTTAAGSAQSPTSFRVVYQRFFLAANQTDNTISVMQQEPSSGELLHKSYIFTGAGTQPRSIAASPSAAFVYASFPGTNEIGVFALSAAGLLTPVQTLAAGTAVGGLAVHPSGNFLFVANPSANTVTSYAIAANGTLGAASSISSGPSPVSVAVHPSGSFVYVPCAFNGPLGNSVSVYAVASNGSLSLVERKGAGKVPSDFQIHPNGLFAYSVASADSAVRAFSIAFDGRLTLVNTVGTGPLGATPSSFTIDPAGRYGFVVNQSTNDTISYAIDPVTGALTILGFLAPTGGQGPSMVAADFGGRVFIANRASNDLSMFTVASATGIMTFQRTLRMRQAPSALLRIDAPAPVTGTARFAYVTNGFNGPQGNSVSAFQIAANGALTPLGSPSSAGIGPNGVAVDPTGQLLFASNQASPPGAPFLSQYKTDPGVPGSLLANGSVNVGDAGVALGNAKAVATEPSGRFVYAGNIGSIAGDGKVSGFLVDFASGNFGDLSAMPGSPFDIVLSNTGANNTPGVLWLNANPAGNLLYVLSNSPQKRMHVYAIDPANGELLEVGQTNLSNPATAGAALLFAVHPNGRFVAVIDLNSTTNRVVMFNTLADGTLAGSPTNAATGTGPSGLAFHPSGSFLYVSVQNSDSLATFSVNPSTGALTKLDADPVAAGVQDTSTGDAPLGVAVDPTGSFLYVTNSGAVAPDPNSISMYSIGTNGLPTLVGILALGTKTPNAIATVATYQ